MEANQTDIRENKEQKKAVMIDVRTPSDRQTSSGTGSRERLEKELEKINRINGANQSARSSPN